MKIDEGLYAKVLIGLLRYGGHESPRTLAKKLGEKRTHVEKALSDLIRVGLVRDTPLGEISFGPPDPTPEGHARDVVGQAREKIKQAAAGVVAPTASVRRL
jgi:hypothetical protein